MELLFAVLYILACLSSIALILTLFYIIYRLLQTNTAQAEEIEKLRLDLAIEFDIASEYIALYNNRHIPSD